MAFVSLLLLVLSLWHSQALAGQNSQMVNNRSDATILPPSTWGIIEFITPKIYWRYTSDGPADTWNPVLGHIAKSTDSPSYELNFPTTGADGLYFDFMIRGDATGLTWDPVTHEGITATVTPQTECNYVKNWIDDCYIVYRVKLTGPHGRSQWYNSNPSPIAVPRLPQTFELVGRDSNGEEIIKYGFVLRQWFLSRGVHHGDTIPNLTKWCNRLGYRMPQVKDLTNAKCEIAVDGSRCVKYQVDRGTPSSTGDHYMYAIGAGILAEWGDMAPFHDLGLGSVGFRVATTDTTRSEDGYYDHYCFSVYMQTGAVNWLSCNSRYNGVCITP